MEKNQVRAGRWTKLLACTVLLSLAGCGEQAQQQGGERPPTAVTVETLKTQHLELTDTLAGRVNAPKIADIRPQVSGILIKRFFKEGDRVEKGDKLYQIDPAPYEAALASAEGDLAVAKATEFSARLRSQRYKDLVNASAVSRQEADDAEAEWKEAAAQIKIAEAAVRSAKIDLGYTTITAPITGTISRSSITVGALVSTGQTNPLTTIRQLSPIYVDFQMPATEVARINGQEGPKNKVTLKLDDGSTYPEQGHIIFHESHVDEGTGTVNVRSEFTNKQHGLMPGLFVRAQVVTDIRDDALLAPQEGVPRQPHGAASALVVNSDNKVENRAVEIERAVGNQWLIKSGLKAGDRVIVSGIQKVKPGQVVTPQQPSQDNGNDDAASAQH